MTLTAKRVQALEADRNVGRDYDRAGERYRAYADGDAGKLYQFDSQYAYGDREIWGIVEQTLSSLRNSGATELSVLDLGCGPGTWLRRIVDRAGQLGFTRINARGVDLAEAQVRRARLLSGNLANAPGVTLRFEAGDIRQRQREADHSVDICLCLYGVLNHLAAEDLPGVFAEAARITRGKLIATLRAIGSRPTIYVDAMKAARAYHQDNVHGQLSVEFKDGTQTSFPSRLFTAAQITGCAAPLLQIDELSGLDFFHGRFAPDPDWNPPEAQYELRFAEMLLELERRFRHEPAFVDHATHLLLVARPREELKA